MSVQVAVRVRPFNIRQKNLGCQCIVDMKDPMTILKPHNGNAQRKFTFDFSFWSFDGYETLQNGYMKPTGDKYSDQKIVFQKIGTRILDNASKGYHCCLFAYGQTGSGKSYSMIGYGQNRGIVPITCEQMFSRMNQKKQGLQIQVHASMIQIYNQKVQDLTIDCNRRPNQGLKIRQSKLLGVYVDGVKKHYVHSFKQIQNVMQLGTKNRTVAATQMNATSSRAHTIITIQFKQIKKVGQAKSQTISMINLVDLAGSQRQAKTGATGDRLKQAVGINQSLTTLGQVISILADNAQGADKFVPYRNSALTRILQNALGGNSQTIMICAISPATDNYDETLSTLRYADRAKKIKNKPVVNESQTDKLIRQLRAQNERLRALLQGREQPKKTLRDSDGNSFEQSEDDIAANLRNLSILMNNHLMSKQQKRQAAQKEQQQMKKRNQEYNGQQQILDQGELQDLRVTKKKLPPYFQNISRDIMLNRKLKILLQKKHIRIGKKGCEPPNQIIFGGRDMKPKHATLDIISGQVILTPLSNDCHLYVNGLPVRQKTILKHLDRVIFGWNSVYLFKDKDHRRQNETVKSKDIDWDWVKAQVKKFVDIDQSDSQEGGGCCSIF